MRVVFRSRWSFLDDRRRKGRVRGASRFHRKSRPARDFWNLFHEDFRGRDGGDSVPVPRGVLTRCSVPRHYNLPASAPACTMVRGEKAACLPLGRWAPVGRGGGSILESGAADGAPLACFGAVFTATESLFVVTIVATRGPFSALRKVRAQPSKSAKDAGRLGSDLSPNRLRRHLETRRHHSNAIHTSRGKKQYK